MDVYYTVDDETIARGEMNSMGQPFFVPRIGEQIYLKGHTWTVKNIVWDVEESKVEFELHIPNTKETAWERDRETFSAVPR